MDSNVDEDAAPLQDIITTKLQTTPLKQTEYSEVDVKTYSCKKCSASFPSLNYLKRHNLRTHAERQYICDVCGAAFRENSKLKRHNITHTGETPFQCGICYKLFSLKHNIKMHMLVHTGEKPFKCDECGTAFSQKSNLNAHLLVHSKRKAINELYNNNNVGFSEEPSASYQIESCEVDLPLPANQTQFEGVEDLPLSYRRQLTTSEVDLPTSTIQSKFIGEVDLPPTDQTPFNIVEELPLSCRIRSTPVDFLTCVLQDNTSPLTGIDDAMSASDFPSISSESTPSVEFPAYPNQTELVDNVNLLPSTNGEFPHPTNQFKTHGMVSTHHPLALSDYGDEISLDVLANSVPESIKQEALDTFSGSDAAGALVPNEGVTGVLPSISDTSNLQKANFVEDGKQTYFCRVCDAEFTSVLNLKRHFSRQHAGKQYVCSYCNAVFKENSKLKRHYLIHTGETPYECDVCGKTFSLKQNLKTHVILHTGERPFACNICGSAFSQKSNLNSHMMIHNKPKRIVA